MNEYHCMLDFAKNFKAKIHESNFEAKFCTCFVFHEALHKMRYIEVTETLREVR